MTASCSKDIDIILYLYSQVKDLWRWDDYESRLQHLANVRLSNYRKWTDKNGS